MSEQEDIPVLVRASREKPARMLYRGVSDRGRIRLASPDGKITVGACEHDCYVWDEGLKSEIEAACKAGDLTLARSLWRQAKHIH